MVCASEEIKESDKSPLRCITNSMWAYERFVLNNYSVRKLIRVSFSIQFHFGQVLSYFSFEITDNAEMQK